MKIGQLSIVVTLILILVAPALAQRKKGPGYAGCTPQCSTTCVDQRWHQMAANFDNLRLIKLLEAVDLNEDQSTQFIPVFNSFRKTKKQLRDQRRELIDRLAVLSTMKEDSNKGEIDTAIKSLKDNSDKLKAARDKFHQACGNILAPNQLARMLVFQERFEREILESLREFRHFRGQPKAKHP